MLAAASVPQEQHSICSTSASWREPRSILSPPNCRWVGGATRVLAMSKTVCSLRVDQATAAARAVTVPDHVDVLAEMACGAQAHFQFSAVRGAPAHTPCLGLCATCTRNVAHHFPRSSPATRAQCADISIIFILHHCRRRAWADARVLGARHWGHTAP